MNGRFTIIADPPGTRSDRLSYETVDINNRGQIVGFDNDDEGNTTTGFLRTTRGRFVDINVPGSQVTAPFRVNDRHQVVGLYVDAGGAAHGFRRDDGGYETNDVPGANGDVRLRHQQQRPDGRLLPRRRRRLPRLHACQGPAPSAPCPRLPAPSPGRARCRSRINERGQMVAAPSDAQGGSRGYLYERGRFRMIAATPTYTRAIDINNRGQIVGDYGTRP